MFSLFSMIWEYKASYLSGIVFFAVAMSGASAMVVTFVGGMYGAAAGGVYMLIQSSARHARLEGGRAQRQQRMRYDPRMDPRMDPRFGGAGRPRVDPRYAHYD